MVVNYRCGKAEHGSNATQPKVATTKFVAASRLAHLILNNQRGAVAPFKGFGFFGFGSSRVYRFFSGSVQVIVRKPCRS